MIKGDFKITDKGIFYTVNGTEVLKNHEMNRSFLFIQKEDFEHFFAFLERFKMKKDAQRATRKGKIITFDFTKGGKNAAK